MPLGPNVDAFEYALEEYVNHKGKLDKRVVALSSGTAAEHLSLIALGVGPGDEDGPVGVNFFYLIVSLNRLILISTYSRTRQKAIFTRWRTTHLCSSKSNLNCFLTISAPASWHV